MDMNDVCRGLLLVSLAACSMLPRAPVATASRSCASGDTLTLLGLGQAPRVATATGETFAQGKPWYRANEAITHRGRRYVKFGYALGTGAPTSGSSGEKAFRAGEYDGVPVYARPPLEPYARFIYVQLNEACQFQPYAEVAEVR
ncbi:MAG TPA: hypothetical protein VF263_12435 [Longimicrobiaceae bacterium]